MRLVDYTGQSSNYCQIFVRLKMQQMGLIAIYSPHPDGMHQLFRFWQNIFIRYFNESSLEEMPIFYLNSANA